MKLYFHPNSPYCQKVLVAMYEKGVAFESEVVNLHDPKARAEYRKSINPLGKLPMLIREDNWVVPESSIIIEYVEGYYPQAPNLIPVERDPARQSRFYDRLGDLYLIEPAIALRDTPAGEGRDALVAHTRTAIGLFEKETANREYLVLGRFTQADIAPAIGLRHLQRQGVDLSAYPKLSAYVERVWARPAWQRLAVQAWGP